MSDSFLNKIYVHMDECFCSGMTCCYCKYLILLKLFQFYCRHTDNTMERPNLSKKINEYTTQKLRQEWAEHEEIFQFDTLEKDKVQKRFNVY